MIESLNVPLLTSDFKVACPSAQVKSVLKHWCYLVALIGIHFMLEYVDSTSFRSLLGKLRIPVVLLWTYRF